MIGVTNSNGTWQFSINGGVTWTTFAANLGNNHAVLLNPAARIRYVPGTNVGTAIITFRAWDQTQGTNGLVNVNIGVNTGGETPISTDTETAQITVIQN